MRILVACEESQEVCKAFRAKGHEAFSCDIIEPSGGHPEWHIKRDVIGLINGYCKFVTLDGVEHELWAEWDLIIAHPPLHLFKYGSNAVSLHKVLYKTADFRKNTEADRCNEIFHDVCECALPENSNRESHRGHEYML